MPWVKLKLTEFAEIYESIDVKSCIFSTDPSNFRYSGDMGIQNLNFVFKLSQSRGFSVQNFVFCKKTFRQEEIFLTG